MGYGNLERCPLLWVMLPERKGRVGYSDYWSGDESDGMVMNANIIGK